MTGFKGKIAAITGGGTGMGRALAHLLATEGCHVAICDVAAEAMAETRRTCEDLAPSGTRFSTYLADVSNASDMEAWSHEVAVEFATDHIDLLFNNAGINGGFISFVDGDREKWEKTFSVCWGGVYNSLRAFLPMLMKSGEARVINTSSVSGFWASMGPGLSNTAYCAAKFAVKGFTEALIEDLAVHAPHIKCFLVMPGHVGTDIAINSMKAYGPRLDVDEPSQLEAAVSYRETAPTTAAEAAQIIVDGVKADRWRILVGRGAEITDRRVRAAPEEAYSLQFFEELVAEVRS